MLYYVPSSLISNSQKLEKTQMSLKGRIDTENVVYLHNGILLSYQKNEFMKFLGKWVELESILSEVTKPQEHTWYAFTDKWILAQKLEIPKTQFTDQMKLKGKEEQSMDTLSFLEGGTKNPQKEI